jgi:CRISPR-associated protein Cst2
MRNNVLGFVMVDAPHSALNNAGLDAGARTENVVVVKFIRKGKSIYPYVSAQAWRYWWRSALEEKFGWKVSPVIRETKIAFTSANPFEFPDDDVFGYMRPHKKELGGVLARISPLKCSPLVSVYEHKPTDDFGVMARQQGDPVPYEHQFYSTTLKGIFSLDLKSVGVFGQSERAGYRNLTKEYTESKDIKPSIKESRAEKKDEMWFLPKKERVKRAKEVVSALPYIYSTTKAASHLTDVTPKLIILTVIEGGNHFFMNITNDSLEKPLLNIAALRQVISDYKDIILSDIYIGRHEGFLENVKEDLEMLQKENSENKGKAIHLSSPKQAVEGFVKALGEYIE